MKYVLVVVFLFSLNLFGQNIDVALDTLTTLDDNEFHLELLSDKPKEKLILPEIKSDNLKYFTLFYSWKTSKAPEIAILVDEKKDSDILYVDKNDDKDLTNDGQPIVFPHSQNQQIIEINAEQDPKQIVRLIIYRVPLIDSVMKQNDFDSNGNLVPEFAKCWGAIKGDFDYKGEKGSFYCDDRVTLRRGKINVEGVTYSIGLFDFSNNGLYNDDDDLLIVDLNNDGKLKSIDPAEIYELNDIINIGNTNYELTYVDKYGMKISLAKTTKALTNYFLHSNTGADSTSGKNNILNELFWKSTYTTLDGKTIEMKDLKGKYILLNVWGEWCSGCKAEIPELKKGYEKWKDKVVFLSFLNTANTDNAKNLILKEKIEWPQIVMDKETLKRFHIRAYPSNILIYPDGKTYLNTGVIHKDFLNLNIK